jgi:excisionase family DNA binding protein
VTHELTALLSAELVTALEAMIDRRVDAALAASRPTGNDSPWLALDEAADYLRVSIRTLERLIRQGRIASTTIGRRRLVHRSALDAYATSGEEIAPATPPRRRGGVG